jgi:hypothetical protein
MANNSQSGNQFTPFIDETNLPHLLMVEFPHQNNYFSLVVSFTITENA